MIPMRCMMAVVVLGACARSSGLGTETPETFTDAVDAAVWDGIAEVTLDDGSPSDTVASDAATADLGQEVAVVPNCPEQAAPTVVGTVIAPQLGECSGLVASRTQADLLWAHNDSGDSASLYALGHDGRLRGVFTVTGASAVDWEDITLRRVGARDDLVIGDIGDNNAQRASIVFYVVEEPALGEAVAEPRDTGPAKAYPAAYPDGPRDAEALVADPEDGGLYVVSKEWSTGVSGLYRYPQPLREGQLVTLEKVASIALDDLGGGLSFLATGADMTPDGRWFLLRTYDDVLGWFRAPGQSLASALNGTRCQLAVRQEPQGEAIAATAEGDGYFTLSEFTDQPLWRFGGLP